MHFPAGSYREHMRSERSQEEVDFAIYTHNLRRICNKMTGKGASIKKLDKGEKKLYRKLQAWERHNG